jgi:hypothetical protein
MMKLKQVIFNEYKKIVKNRFPKIKKYININIYFLTLPLGSSFFFFNPRIFSSKFNKP